MSVSAFPTQLLPSAAKVDEILAFEQYTSRVAQALIIVNDEDCLHEVNILASFTPAGGNSWHESETALQEFYMVRTRFARS